MGDIPRVRLPLRRSFSFSTWKNILQNGGRVKAYYVHYIINLFPLNFTAGRKKYAWDLLRQNRWNKDRKGEKASEKHSVIHSRANTQLLLFYNHRARVESTARLWVFTDIYKTWTRQKTLENSFPSILPI